MASMFKLRSLFLIVNCNIACVKYVLLTWCSFLKRDYFVSPIYIINQIMEGLTIRLESISGFGKNPQVIWVRNDSNVGTN